MRSARRPEIVSACSPSATNTARTIAAVAQASRFRTSRERQRRAGSSAARARSPRCRGSPPRSPSSRGAERAPAAVRPREDPACGGGAAGRGGPPPRRSGPAAPAPQRHCRPRRARPRRPRTRDRASPRGGRGPASSLPRAGLRRRLTRRQRVSRLVPSLEWTRRSKRTPCRSRFGKTVAVDDLSFTVRSAVTGFVGPNGAGQVDHDADRPRARCSRPWRGARRRAALRPFRPPAPRGRRPPRCDFDTPGEERAQPPALAGAQQRDLPRAGGGGARARRAYGGRASAHRRLLARHGTAAWHRGALLGDPRVLLLDEPINGSTRGHSLDPRTAQELADEGRTVFVSSHLMSELEGTADDLVVIGRGRLIAETSVSELLARMSDTRVTVRTPDVAGLMRVLARAGATATRRRTTASSSRAWTSAESPSWRSSIGFASTSWPCTGPPRGRVPRTTRGAVEYATEPRG